MQSLRRVRKQNGQVIAERLEQLRDTKKAHGLEEKALEMAQAALSETPRTLTPCELTLEYTTVSLMVERVECSECGQVSLGYDTTWQFCPQCGSQVTEVGREDSPHDRLTQKAIDRAAAQFEKAKAERKGEWN